MNKLTAKQIAAHKRIVAMAKTHSYTLIAKRFGLTRCAVAGIVWRTKNPGKRRIYFNADGEKSGGKNGNGHHSHGRLPRNRYEGRRGSRVLIGVPA